MTKLNYTEPTNEQLYVCMVWQAITSGHYAPCAKGELKYASKLIGKIIKEHGENTSKIVNLNKEVIRLLVNGDEPEILKREEVP
tara:strand:+ start:192 stop:443 length:252 start_codon:yes stop_codon:yes gene_type:complete